MCASWLSKKPGNRIFCVHLQLGNQEPTRRKRMNDNEIISEEMLEGLGISRPAYEEIQKIIGRLPSLDELSTLLAIWQSQGSQQGLLTWLKGQPHSAERHDYLESDAEPESKEIREPRVKECLEIARSLFADGATPPPQRESQFRHTGDAIYMVGDVSGLFVNSDYGRRYLHLADNPLDMSDDQESRDYMTMILGSLYGNQTLNSHVGVGRGGLFGALVGSGAPVGLGFDILTCREVRLDAFLFGEEGVRQIVTMEEQQEDFFLVKLGEARLNCCFLGRVTKGRVLVDGMDFGDIKDFG